MDLKTVLIQQVYPDLKYFSLMYEFLPRHAQYCAKFGIDYRLFIGEIDPCVIGAWDKVNMINEALKHYDLVVWLDADAVILNTDIDLRSVPLRSGVGAVWFDFPSPHYNTGVMYFRKGRKARRFVKNWLAGFPGDDHWHEQQVFNSMSGVTQLPATWNASRDHNWIDNPIVAAAHGIRPLEARLDFLRSVCLS